MHTKKLAVLAGLLLTMTSLLSANAGDKYKTIKVMAMKAQLATDPAAAPSAHFPMNVKEEIRFSRGQWSSIKGDFYADGNFLGAYRVWATDDIKGYTGGLILIGETADGKVSFVSETMSMGVDGKVFGGFSSSDRTSLIRFKLPEDVASKTVHIRPLFFTDSKRRLKQILADMDEYEKMIMNSQTVKDAGTVIAGLTKTTK